MSRKWLCLLGLLGALAPAGCQSFTAAITAPLAGPTPAPNSESTISLKSDLSTADQFKLCMTTAETLERGGKFVEAIGLYARAREIDPSAERPTRRLAVLYDRIGLFDKAQEEYELALRKAPEDANLCNDLGYSYYNRGQWREAEKYLRKAVALNPKHAAAWTNLGMVLAQEEAYGEALEAFAKVVSPARAKCNVAFILTTQGKREQAKQTYREALALEPGLQLAHAALGKLENPAPTSKEKAPKSAPARAERGRQREEPRTQAGPSPLAPDMTSPVMVPLPGEASPPPAAPSSSAPSRLPGLPARDLLSGPGSALGG